MKSKLDKSIEMMWRHNTYTNIQKPVVVEAFNNIVSSQYEL